MIEELCVAMIPLNPHLAAIFQIIREGRSSFVAVIVVYKGETIYYTDWLVND